MSKLHHDIQNVNRHILGLKSTIVEIIKPLQTVGQDYERFTSTIVEIIKSLYTLCAEHGEDADLRQQKLSSPYRHEYSGSLTDIRSTIVEIVKSLQTVGCRQLAYLISTIVEIVKSLQTTRLCTCLTGIYHSRNCQVLIDWSDRCS